MRFTVALMLAMGFAASAQDGVVLINQDRANAGGITSGDAPGFPVTITEPGSYKLTSNLRVFKANADAILVLTDYVTIDLNGFTIFGPGQGVGFGSGVTYSGQPRHTTVRNGNVTGMGNGVALGDGAVVEKVSASRNTTTGIDVGPNSVVKDSLADGNGITGIIASPGPGGLILNNVITKNQFGLQVSCPSVVLSNMASQNSILDIETLGAGCTRANNSPQP